MDPVPHHDSLVCWTGQDTLPSFGVNLLGERRLKPVWLLTVAAAVCLAHALLNVLFRDRAQSISDGFYIVLSITAAVSCGRRAMHCPPAARRHWVLLATGLCIWCAATMMAARAQFVTRVSPSAAALDDFFYFFYGVPILLSVVSSDESRLSPLFFWIDAVQAAAAGCLAYLAIFTSLPFVGNPTPISVSRLVWIYDGENAVLLLFGMARLLVTPNDRTERRYFLILNNFLWAYLVCAAVYNHIEALRLDAGSFDVLVDLPFLGLACAASLLGFPSGSSGATRLKPLALFIDNARPVAFGFAILALSAVIARQHFAVGMGAAFGAFLLYGIRSAMLQSRFLQSQAALEEAMQRLGELALQDGLTGVANRRCFDERFKLEWNRAQRTQRPLSLLLIDIDHFKLLNDTHGHQAGDECLIQVALLLRRALQRPGDLLARYGGEEFVALLPETDSEGALNVASQMQAFIGGSDPSACLALPLTVSIGVATRHVFRAGSSAQLLETADRALYLAKQNGRDRIEVLPMPPRTSV